MQSLVTIFVESSLGEKREDTVNAVKFIDDQIKRYEAGLKAAEDRLKAFRLKYLGVSNVATQNYFTRLTTLNDQIEATKLQLRAAEESRDAYKRELAGEAPVLLPEVAPSSAPSTAGVMVPGTDARLATLKTDLDVLRRRYTDDHPDVVGVKRIIDQLEEQRKQEVAALNKVTPVGTPQDFAASRNPVFQQLKIALADGRGQRRVAARHARSPTSSSPRSSFPRRGSCRRWMPNSRSSTATTTSRRRPTRRCSRGASRRRWAKAWPTPAARASR